MRYNACMDSAVLFDSIRPRKVKKIYFVGVKGVGMTALALIASEAGYAVRGSDVEEEFLTDNILSRAKISMDVGFDTTYLDKFAGENPSEVLLITTAAHGGLENPQVVHARELKIPILTHGQALGYFMRGDLLRRKGKIQGISIIGSHGKTTTTAMVATFLAKAGFDPSYAVGTSEIFPLGNPGHFGRGAYFVAEGDEYASDIKSDRTPKFFYQQPQIAVFTNLDFDHPDFYADIEDIVRVDREFMGNLAPGSTLIVSADDPRLMKIADAVHNTLNVITVGAAENADFRLTKFTESGLNSFLRVSVRGMDLGEFSLSVPGYHNAKNALNGIAILTELGVGAGKIKEVLPVFTGTKRRIEIMGKTRGGATVIDDYAHHPEEIKATLASIHSAYPGKQIACFFQPHMLSRTRALARDFAGAFEYAGLPVFLPIFASKREEKTGEAEVIAELKEAFRMRAKNVVFLDLPHVQDSPLTISENRLAVVKYIEQNCNTDAWVIVTMGAGDIYRVATDLICENS